MKIAYAVTFEFMTLPPATHRGTVAARQVATCASRALKEAQKALRPVNWSSCVFVALERLDRAEDIVAEDETALEAVAPED